MLGLVEIEYYNVIILKNLDKDFELENGVTISRAKISLKGVEPPSKNQPSKDK